MEQEFGEQTTKALAKYDGVLSLTKANAKEIINTIWPDAEKASPAEVFKAITLCTQYGLNPLMKHLFLVPFWNKERNRDDYVCIMGIASPRLIASRKHHWTFLDDTPRIGTEEEEKKHYRSLNPDKLRAIAKMRDLNTGAEMTAWGEWPLTKTPRDGNVVANEPKGTDKGNSMENMVCIHAERKGLDMLYPADMPPNDIPIMDERYIEGKGSIVDIKVEEESPAKAKKTKAKAEPVSVELQPTEQPPISTGIPWESVKPGLTALYQTKKEEWSVNSILARLADLGADTSGGKIQTSFESLAPENKKQFAETVAIAEGH